MTLLLEDPRQDETVFPFGTLRFENYAPGEWLTKKGEPAKVAKRQYTLFRGESEFVRGEEWTGGEKMDAVTNISKTGDDPSQLFKWYENNGFIGGAKAQALGELDGVPEEDIPDRCRLLELGASAARDQAAERGRAIHTAFHRLATTGEVPRPSNFPAPWRPWVHGAVRAWLALEPEPLQGEFMVCHPEYGYAGRPDLIALVNGKRTLLDWKTSKSGIRDAAHFQTRGYEQCFGPCGIEPVEAIVIVGVDGEGGFCLEDCEVSAEEWFALVRVFRSVKGLRGRRAAARRAVRAAAA